MPAAVTTNRDKRRVTFGDWQTPYVLAKEVVQLMMQRGTPAAVLEPTCGTGTFLQAAASLVPQATLTGFDISSEYVEHARRHLPDTRTSVNVADFFDVQWQHVVSELATPLLVVGNPPWVTNAVLGRLAAGNLPSKSNFKRLAGMDAMTGKSNFDISEWMIIRLLEVLHDRDYALAMLCKASVARRVIEHAAAQNWRLTGDVRTIDVRRHFAVTVDAVVLRLWPARYEHIECVWPVFDSIDATEPSRVMGLVSGHLCSDVHAYERTKVFGGSATTEWRSGLKHDCSKVMELDCINGKLSNGFGETVDVEAEHVFPLLKGSDVANGVILPRKAVVVTQRNLGDDTSSLRTTAPRTWEYLHRHRQQLDARKSRIYHGQPKFSIFGIGDYAFAPYKVAICGMYKRLAFSLIRPVDGRPVMVDDTVYFLPCDTEEDGQRIMQLLTDNRAKEFFEARIFWDSKRPISKTILQELNLDKLSDR